MNHSFSFRHLGALLTLLSIAACGEKAAAPVPALTKPVMEAATMVAFQCDGEFGKIKPLVDACDAEKQAGKEGVNCAELAKGNSEVAERNMRSPGACSPKIRF